MNLANGYNCRDKCHRCALREWWDVKGAVRRLQPADVNPRPFKDLRSPLRDLMYFQGNPKYVRIDGAHTYAIDGIGKNYLATAILLLLHMDYFGSGSTESKFETAYKRYMIFCAANGKSTSIHEFSYKTLKLKTGSLRGKPCGLGKGHDAAIVGAWLGGRAGPTGFDFGGTIGVHMEKVLTVYVVWTRNHQ
ncbi:unnamed protein product [Durusdinium trenchii]|uniref:Uncharacterized protein n=1 Tax=Durusdinium trenchii TaxID=1381693 RepID=A0ABP0PZM3_9DINO